jgi:hypothetical protein
MREMWEAAGRAAWRVGDASARLLSPTEVLFERLTLRSELVSRIAKLKARSQPEQWAQVAKTLDVLVVQGSEGQAAFDTQQQVVSPSLLERLHYRQEAFSGEYYYLVGSSWLKQAGAALPGSLASEITNSLLKGVVEALIKRFPQAKKLTVDQAVGEVRA